MRYSGFAAAVAAMSFSQFASAAAASGKGFNSTCAGAPATVTVTKTVTTGINPNNYPITTYHAGGDGPTATITADNQKVTSIDLSTKITSFHCDSPGVYTPPHQSNVWTVYEPTWVTYEVPCATAYVIPYNQATCQSCTKNVEVIVYIDVDIITYSEQIWKVVEGHTTTVIKTVTATPSYVTSYISPATTAPPQYAAATHTVKVGGLAGNVIGGVPILKYDPEFVDAKVGDVVLFDILANNHTVTESSFDEPCVPVAGGVDSGFRPNKENTPGKATFAVTIKDDEPKWFYCAQPGNGKPHCQAGMVFAINAPKTGDKTLDAFRKMAAAVPVGTPTDTGPTTTHTVKVGGLTGNVTGGVPILKYDPEFVDAKVGDVVLFDILANNHTVTESSFDEPCVPVAGGVDSGFRPNKENTPGKATFAVTIKDDEPKWFYCAQPGNGNPHCQAGMVFAINAPKTGDKTLDAFKKSAAAVPVSGSPDPIGANSTTSTGTATPTATGPAVTHFVKVGGLAGNVTILKYDPESVKANVGDFIQFDILAANHTVTESSFDAPCVPNKGIDSGFRPNVNNTPGAQLFSVAVTDGKPKWFYCAQPGNGKPHCQAGMVFAINPPAYGNTLDAFKAKAAAVPIPPA